MFFFMWRGCVAIDIYQVTRYVASGILLHNYSIPQSIWAISLSTCPSLLCWSKCEEKISRQLQNSIWLITAFNDTINDDFLKCYTTDTSSTLTAYFVPLDTKGHILEIFRNGDWKMNKILCHYFGNFWLSSHSKHICVNVKINTTKIWFF